jgi:hypothetical protein
VPAVNIESDLLLHTIVSVNSRWRAIMSFAISHLKMGSKTPQVVNFANKNLKNSNDVVLKTRVSAPDSSRYVCPISARLGLKNWKSRLDLVSETKASTASLSLGSTQ